MWSVALDDWDGLAAVDVVESWDAVKAERDWVRVAHGDDEMKHHMVLLVSRGSGISGFRFFGNI